MKFIEYTAGYEYQLETEYTHATGITPRAPGGNHFVRMEADGLLVVSRGYAWDGASGPAIDTPTFMRGSLVHDALYQLMRLGVLSKDTHRQQADEVLRKVVIEDGMWTARAWWVYHAVRLFGGHYMRHAPNKILTAPPQLPPERFDYS